MAWVGREVACKTLQGLCKPGLLETRHGTKAALKHSFDCSKLISVQAQLICGDAELVRLDKTLARVYDQKIKGSSNKTRLRTDQRTWLRNSRNACHDKACLQRSYRLRINELMQMRA
nr:lysozyme inhibitor LprI family protein [Paraburkholderia sp. BL8N3]